MSLPRRPTAVVTGGGRGIGREFACLLAERGARVVVADLDLDAAEGTVSDLRRLGAEAHAQRCDVACAEDVERLAEDVESRFGPTDLLINNAGVLVSGPLLEMKIEDYERVTRVNLHGVVHGCHAFVPTMVARGRGHVLNVASLAGPLSVPRMGPYNASKAAVISLSETLASELAGTGVGVTVLCPSFTRTDLVAASHGPADARTRDLGSTLLKRWGASPRRVAKVGLDAVGRGDLYAIPTLHGRLAWYAKRIAPTSVHRLAGWLNARV